MNNRWHPDQKVNRVLDAVELQSCELPGQLLTPLHLLLFISFLLTPSWHPPCNLHQKNQPEGARQSCCRLV